MDAVIGVSGSSPAYVFMFIEAMADAAVQAGMPRSQAYEFAAQSVMGSAKMVLETGKHPAELKDMVCSPAGTTIEAVKVPGRERIPCSCYGCHGSLRQQIKIHVIFCKKCIEKTDKESVHLTSGGLFAII